MFSNLFSVCTSCSVSDELIHPWASQSS